MKNAGDFLQRVLNSNLGIQVLFHANSWEHYFGFNLALCNFLVIVVFIEVSFHPGLHFEGGLHKSALEKSTWAGVSWDDLLWSPFCALLFLLIHRLTYYFYVYTIIDRDSSLLSAFLYPGHSVILTVLWHLHENKKPYI